MGCICFHVNFSFSYKIAARKFNSNITQKTPLLNLLLNWEKKTAGSFNCYNLFHIINNSRAYFLVGGLVQRGAYEMIDRRILKFEYWR